jgi:hypothetical protein
MEFGSQRRGSAQTWHLVSGPRRRACGGSNLSTPQMLVSGANLPMSRILNEARWPVILAPGRRRQSMTPKPLPTITRGMTAGTLQALCARDGPWTISEHKSVGNHAPIVDLTRTVLAYCPENQSPQEPGIDLGVELDPTQGGLTHRLTSGGVKAKGAAEKKPLPEITPDMTAAQLQEKCMPDQWTLRWHTPSGQHRVISDWSIVVRRYCAHNPSPQEPGIDLGVELDSQPESGRRHRPRKKKATKKARKEATKKRRSKPPARRPRGR